MSTLAPLVRPSWLPEVAWPWPASALVTPAGRVAVTDAGRGPVLLLIHVGTWSFVWRDLLRELTPHFRCIAVDAPGCGRSDRPGAAGTTLTMAAAAAVSILDRLDLHDVTLVAHDLGGPAGFAAAADRADRVNALVAVNTFAWRPAGALFRGMLTAMGSAAVRETDAALGWLPRATSSRFGVGRHWSAADRRVFVAGIDAAARRSWHRYFGDAHRANSLYAAVEAALRGPLADRPLLTIFGERNDRASSRGGGRCSRMPGRRSFRGATTSPCATTHAWWPRLCAIGTARASRRCQGERGRRLRHAGRRQTKAERGAGAAGRLALPYRRPYRDRRAYPRSVGVRRRRPAVRRGETIA